MEYKWENNNAYLCTKLLMEQYRPAKYLVTCTENIGLGSLEHEELVLTKWMLKYVDNLMKFIRGHHPKGEQFYQVLYYSYVFERKLNINMLCNRVGINTIGQSLTRATIYRWRKSALEALASCMWGKSEEHDLRCVEYLEHNVDASAMSCVSQMKMRYPQ